MTAALGGLPSKVYDEVRRRLCGGHDWGSHVGANCAIVCACPRDGRERIGEGLLLPGDAVRDGFVRLINSGLHVAFVIHRQRPASCQK